MEVTVHLSLFVFYPPPLLLNTESLQSHSTFSTAATTETRRPTGISVQQVPSSAVKLETSHLVAPHPVPSPMSVPADSLRRRQSSITESCPIFSFRSVLMDTSRLVGATSKDTGTWRLVRAVALGLFQDKLTSGWTSRRHDIWRNSVITRLEERRGLRLQASLSQ